MKKMKPGCRLCARDFFALIENREFFDRKLLSLLRQMKNKFSGPLQKFLPGKIEKVPVRWSVIPQPMSCSGLP